MKIKSKILNFLCMFGFHDWEELKCRSLAEIKADVTRDRLDYSTEFYKEKICLRCAKYVDEITPKYTSYKKEQEEENKKIKYRKELAIKLFHEVKKKN